MAPSAELSRNTLNQRAARARRKTYIGDLERRIRDYEAQGVQATEQVQTAARLVADQNHALREEVRVLRERCVLLEGLLTAAATATATATATADPSPSSSTSRHSNAGLTARRSPAAANAVRRPRSRLARPIRGPTKTKTVEEEQYPSPKQDHPEAFSMPPSLTESARNPASTWPHDDPATASTWPLSSDFFRASKQTHTENSHPNPQSPGLAQGHIQSQSLSSCGDIQHPRFRGLFGPDQISKLQSSRSAAETEAEAEANGMETEEDNEREEGDMFDYSDTSYNSQYHHHHQEQQGYENGGHVQHDYHHYHQNHPDPDPELEPESESDASAPLTLDLNHPNSTSCAQAALIIASMRGLGATATDAHPRTIEVIEAEILPELGCVSEPCSQLCAIDNSRLFRILDKEQAAESI